MTAGEEVETIRRMTPVYQTKYGVPFGNCVPACVASLLDRKIEDVDVDVASCRDSLRALLTKIEEKANCKIYVMSHEAIVDRIVKTSERYCFVEVCTCVFNQEPFGRGSTWHVVVCEIGDNGRLSLVFNPDQHDARKDSLDQFPAIGKLFIVKANPAT